MKKGRYGEVIVVGYGWVGQANALALAQIGYPVFYYDIIEPLHFYEDEYKNLYSCIKPLKDPLDKDNSKACYLVCVKDKVSEDGKQDISHIKKALNSLENAKGIIILRSTVLPQHLKKLNFDYYVPEFLHEKQAVEEVLNPFYFVVGRRQAAKNEPELFSNLENRAKKIFRGTPEQASYIKYLSNTWNTLRIAFVNEFGNIIKVPKTKAHREEIEKITDFFFEKKDYLRYGRSFGGHCLPKDLLAITNIHKDKNIPILKAIFESNEFHKKLEQKHSHIPEWFSKWEK